MSVEVEIEATLAECTDWGLSRVYRFEGDPPGAEMKLTLTRGQETFPTIKVGDPVMIILSWEDEEDQPRDDFIVPPGPDGTARELEVLDPADFTYEEPFGAWGPLGRCPRCDGRRVYARRTGPGPDDVDWEPCDCMERP